MGKLEPQVWYYQRCEYCQKVSGRLARDENVNVMSDGEVRVIAERRLGKTVPEECVHCGLFTLQTIVAYKWQEAYQ